MDMRKVFEHIKDDWYSETCYNVVRYEGYLNNFVNGVLLFGACYEIWENIGMVRKEYIELCNRFEWI